jgi:signal transduction histidine kinase
MDIEVDVLRAAFEHALDGVIFLDSEKRWVDANDAALALFGRSRDELIGHDVAEFAAPGIVAEIGWSEFVHEGAHRGRWALALPDHRVRYVDYAAVANVRPGLHLSIVRDATERVEKDEAQRALEKLRTEWAVVVAHDLQQPLSVIRMSDEVLTKSLASDDDARRALERIQLSVERMGTMIGELIDTSLVEARRVRLRLEHVPIAAMLHALARELASAASANDATIVVDAADDVAVVADAARLEQIFGNLVSNACKYGARGRAIQVRAELVEYASAPAVCVTVENEGPTIAPNDLARLFERFYRTDDAQAGAEGLGLGLYIVRGLVSAHGGVVSATSEDGRTRFEVVLPVDAA